MSLLEMKGLIMNLSNGNCAAQHDDATLHSLTRRASCVSRQCSSDLVW